MAEYQDILRYLVCNPPHRELDKQMHASLLEMLAKKLRGEEVNLEEAALKARPKVISNNRRLH